MPAAARRSSRLSVRRRLAFDVVATPSRRAVIGEIRVARSAGTRLARTVMSVPRPTARRTVRAAITRPALGRPKPTLSSSRDSSGARPIPASSPRTEPANPTTSASATTDVSTWRRETPMVRSIPNSRVRWATVMVNVLKMTNDPTSNAIGPNISRPYVRYFRI
jgi:hypothetical protein